jgi:alkaline phosphatase
MKKYSIVLAAALAVLPVSAEESAPKAKNVILMIGDGMGFAHVDIGSMYQYGETGVQPYEDFDHFACATYGVGGDYEPAKSGDYEYLKKLANDSAGTATTMASGVKTYPGAVGVGPDKEPLKLITTTAQETGRVHGVVSSVMFNHATPASFLAHVPGRTQYSDIARGMFASGAKVIMGAGHPEYDKEGNRADGAVLEDAPWVKKEDDPYARVGGKETWDQIKAGTLGGDIDGDGEADPWKLVETREDFEALVEGETPKRVFGLARVGSTLQVERKGDPAAAPFTDPFLDTVPSLTTMSLGALNVLDDHPAGFFLMIEGGAIDWASHANVAGRMVEEQIDFNRTIETVIQWIEKNSSWDETLLIITADHECGYVLGPGSNPELKPIENRGKGVLPGFEFHSGGHTNQLVPLYFKGPGAVLFKDRIEGEDPKHGPYVHDSSIHDVMAAVLR